MNDIQCSQDKNVGLITLNRPQALNALNLTMIQAIQRQLSIWQEEQSIQAVVIRSSSNRAFCAGGDVRLVYEDRGNLNKQMEFFWNEYRLNHYIHHYPKPFIALIDGICMGGGIGISLHGSHPVASVNSVFAMPETAIGLFPDIGASYLLSRCLGQYGIYLALTGDRFTAKTAQQLALVKYLIDAERFDAVLDHLMELDLSANPHDQVDTCLRQFLTPNPIDKLDNAAQIDGLFARETVESLFDALQENQASTWHQAIFNILKQKSPLSLMISLRQMQYAKNQSLAECLKMDYRLVKHCMMGHDFYEGVRALLVDKDKTPRWQPMTIKEISTESIERYFDPVEPELWLDVDYLPSSPTLLPQAGEGSLNCTTDLIDKAPFSCKREKGWG